ncbi:MAG TPA: glycosyl hydrolase family 28-related protein, partial [Bryobacteraceae bacterium]|nr:glycosyl hydrolase family 28-related protein [Bryobacteraceae bacterium]
DNDFRNWAVVTDYGAVPNDPGDDTGEIQAALNSGKPTVFLPSGTYRISGTLHIPSTVRRVLGVISQITIWNTQRAAYPVFSCDAASGGPVEIRSIVFDIYSVGKPSILNNCAVPLVIADVFNANGYENVPGKGLEVYFENAAIPGGVIQHGGRVWARQLDVENDATHVLNDGATFWVLGYKTEGSGDSGNGLLFTRNGGSTEVIGAFNSTPDAGPYARPAYSAVDSKLSISALSAGYRIGKVLSEQRNGQTVTYPNSNTRYGGTALSLYSGR